MSARTSELIEGLRRPDAYPHATSRFDVIETHISFVVLTGRYAYKIKKDVRLPFVDFSTLERRRHDCERELELNRRTAAEMYLEVVPIGGPPELPVVGATPAIEYAVKMLAFDPDATADRLLDRDALTAPMLETLARRLALFHASLDPLTGGSPIERMHTNLDQLEPRPHEEIARIRGWIDSQDAVLGDSFAARARAGFTRDCHGDLHLGNLAAIDGVLVPFDCLEFDDALRAIDIADEISFLAMDLMARERSDLAYIVLNACLRETGDYACLQVIRYYLVHRALVRSKVRRLTADPDAEHDDKQRWPYLTLADRLTRPVRPLLVITMGFSGSGKTTVTEPLIARLPALRVRSDIERKRLHGLAARESSDSPVGGGIYDEHGNDATYDRLYAGAEAALSGGINLIVDAAFLNRARRRRFADLAAQYGAHFVILNCTAPETVLRERIAHREADREEVSEAGVAVLEAQLASADAPDAAESEYIVDVDTTQAPDPRALAGTITARGEVNAGLVPI